MSAKDKAWSNVMKYAATIAREKRGSKTGNPHLSWRDAQKRAWTDPRVIKRQAEYHIKYDKKTGGKRTTPKKSTTGKKPRGRPPGKKSKPKPKTKPKK
jgi:hypothetical protein